jgi:acylphosphatase
MQVQVEVHIYGIVQGVGFRNAAKHLADEKHLLGFAQNMKVGSVYIVAQGEEKDVAAFVDWCRVGPSRARVDRIEVIRIDELAQYGNFAIL